MNGKFETRPDEAPCTPSRPSPGPRRTIAIKFCGGCNPTFDRLPYWKQIRSETAEVIRWVGPDDPTPDGFLLICGCHAACPLKFFNPKDYGQFFLVTNAEKSPVEIAEKLCVQANLR